MLNKRYHCQKIRKSPNEFKFKIKRPKVSSKPDKDYGNAEPLDGTRSIDDKSFLNDMEQFLKYKTYNLTYT